MFEAASTAGSSPAIPPDTGAEPWTACVAWQFLDEPARADLSVLFRFIAAVRAVADHPALSPERKEAALAALAAPFGAKVEPAQADDTWKAPAVALADLLAIRGIDSRPAWHILQAAGQDLRKTRYRDWSDLLTWCRFGAAPAGALVARLLGADDATAKRAESLAIAVQLVEIVNRASSHYRWLGRIYLPQRWFTEARGVPADLGFHRRSPALKTVLGRALDQATTLIEDAKSISKGFGDWHRRAAAAAQVLELRAEIRALARADTQEAPRPPSALAARLIRLRAMMRALLSRP
jgi:phytoene/squalene synthetase